MQRLIRGRGTFNRGKFYIAYEKQDHGRQNLLPPSPNTFPRNAVFQYLNNNCERIIIKKFLNFSNPLNRSSKKPICYYLISDTELICLYKNKSSQKKKLLHAFTQRKNFLL